MKKRVDFFGGDLNGGQAGRPWAILLVGEKHQQGRNIEHTSTAALTACAWTDLIASKLF